tara:strand:- start:141 stop:386 length:246 start_codon:yes stop_codon:yes gene_type:complete
MIRQQVTDENNPYLCSEIKTQIIDSLEKEGYTLSVNYDIIYVPNITNIGYGRDVGYTIKQYDLGEEIHKISGTKIRNEIKH